MPFFRESPNEFCLYACLACIIATRSFELRASLVTSNHPSFRAAIVKTGGFVIIYELFIKSMTSDKKNFSQEIYYSADFCTFDHHYFEFR